MVATDDPETTIAVVRVVRHAFPQAALVVRAHDRIHAVRLANEGVPADAILRETLDGALELGARVLTALGYGEGEARDVAARIREPRRRTPSRADRRRSRPGGSPGDRRRHRARAAGPASRHARRRGSE